MAFGECVGGAGVGGGEDVPFFVEYRNPSTGEECNRESEGNVDGNHADDGGTTKGPTSARGGGGRGGGTMMLIVPPAA